MCDHYKLGRYESPFNNFRDALSHYILCYEAYDAGFQDEGLIQEASIKERLYRGAKDGCVYILHAMRKRS